MGIRCSDHVTPLYPQKLALTSPTGGGRSVGVVRSRTKATEFFIGRSQWPCGLRRRSAGARFTIPGGIVVSPTHRTPLPQGDTPGALISVRGCYDHRAKTRPENLIQLKIPMTSTGNRTRDLPICALVPQKITVLK